MEDLMRDCEAIVEVAARAVGHWPTAWRARDAPRRGPRRRCHCAAGPFERTTVRELLQAHAGIELRGDESAGRDARPGPARRQPGGDRRRLGRRVLSSLPRPHRAAPGQRAARPSSLDWPRPLAALARRKPGDPLTVERFELYAGGLELANAFGELTDPVEQRRRFVEEIESRKQRGKAVYPIDEKLLEALGAHAADLRHRPGLRPADDAGPGRVKHSGCPGLCR